MKPIISRNLLVYQFSNNSSMRVIIFIAICVAAAMAVPAPAHSKISHPANPWLSFAEKNLAKFKPLRDRHFITKLLNENPVGLKEVAKQFVKSVEDLNEEIDKISKALVAIIRDNDLQNELEEKLPSIVDESGTYTVELVEFFASIPEIICWYFGCEAEPERIIDAFISGIPVAALALPYEFALITYDTIKELSPAAGLLIRALLYVIEDNLLIIFDKFSIVFEEAWENAFPDY